MLYVPAATSLPNTWQAILLTPSPLPSSETAWLLIWENASLLVWDNNILRCEFTNIFIQRNTWHTSIAFIGVQSVAQWQPQCLIINMQDDGMSMARDGIRQRADRVTRLDFSRQGFIRKPNQHRIIHSPLHILCTLSSAHWISNIGWKGIDCRQKPLLDCRMPRARRSYATCKTIVCHVPYAKQRAIWIP